MQLFKYSMICNDFSMKREFKQLIKSFIKSGIKETMRLFITYKIADTKNKRATDIENLLKIS